MLIKWLKIFDIDPFDGQGWTLHGFQYSIQLVRLFRASKRRRAFWRLVQTSSSWFLEGGGIETHKGYACTQPCCYTNDFGRLSPFRDVVTADPYHLNLARVPVVSVIDREAHAKTASKMQSISSALLFVSLLIPNVKLHIWDHAG